MNIENKGFEAYAEKDKKIQEEVKTGQEVTQMFDELNKIVSYSLRHGAYLPNAEEISKGGERSMVWVKSFVGHPERVTWLNSFVEDAKAQMRAVVPTEEADIDVILNKEKRLAFQQKYRSNPAIWRAIISVADKLQTEFLNKTIDFDDEDALQKAA